jgi:hypothetical protein
MPQPTTFDPAVQLRLTQTIVVALAAGVVVFAVVAAFLGPISEPFPPIVMGLDPIALAAIACTVSVVFVLFIVPQRRVDSVRDGEPDQRVHMFRASRLVAAALCEGPALFWGVALLLSGTWWYLVPIGMLTGLLVMQVPTRDSFERATGVRILGS